MNARTVSTLRSRHLRLGAGPILAVLACTCWAQGQGASPWTDRHHGVIRDRDTGLDWTRADNGHDIDWNTARTRCAARGVGWRLPTADELETVYRAATAVGESAQCGDSVCHLSALFKLSGGWFWSSTDAGSEKDDGRALYFGVLMANGKRTPNLAEFDYGSRALCVRR